MSDSAPQSFKNHARFDPPYHFVLTTVLAVNLFIVCCYAYRHLSWFTEWMVVLSIAVFIPFAKLRSYPLKIQDRVIRLEERLRLTALLSPADRVHIDELSIQQLIALRFASDAELPTLVHKTLTERLEPKAIKQHITNWRADYDRV